MRARAPEEMFARRGRPSLTHALTHAPTHPPAGVPMLAGLLTLILSLALAAPAALAQPELPPGQEGAAQRLETSPRHGEYVMVDVPGRDGPVNTFVVYPERSEDAPVVIVIHEIYGMTDWIKSVADQLAADGFIALAPDLLTGKAPGGGGTADFPDRDAVVGAIRALPEDEVVSSLDAVRAYGISLPASTDRSATVGYCWGGSTSFMYATRQPDLDAAVVYYGTSPEGMAAYRSIGAAVLGLYGGDDNRVNSTIPRAEEAMSELGQHEGDPAGLARDHLVPA